LNLSSPNGTFFTASAHWILGFELRQERQNRALLFAHVQSLCHEPLERAERLARLKAFFELNRFTLHHFNEESVTISKRKFYLGGLLIGAGIFGVGVVGYLGWYYLYKPTHITIKCPTQEEL